MSALEGTAGRRRIYLMRHGHVDYFAKHVVDSGDTRLARLTEQGQEEANAAGLALRHVKFDLAVSSGLHRTQQTAEIVLELNEGAPILEQEPRLVELHSDTYVQFESKDHFLEFMLHQYENAGDDGARYFGDGELFSEAMERTLDGLTALLNRPNWSTALVVAHEGINRVILSWMCHAGLRALESFEQDTGCINVLDFDLLPSEDGDGTRIDRRIMKSVNLTPKNYIKHGMNLRSLEAIFIGGPS